MSVAVSLVAADGDGKTALHDRWFMQAEGSPSQQLRSVLRTLAENAQGLANSLAPDLAKAASEVLQRGPEAAGIVGSRPGEASTTWKPAMQVGMALAKATTADLGNGLGAASGELVLAVDGREMLAGVPALALQTRSALLVLQHRPLLPAARHAYAVGDGPLQRVRAQVPQATIGRALSHKAKRSLQKAEHTAAVRAIVPVHTHLDAKLLATPFGVVWQTSLNGASVLTAYA